MPFPTLKAEKKVKLEPLTAIETHAKAAQDAELARRNVPTAPDIHTSIPPEPGSIIVAAWQLGR